MGCRTLEVKFEVRDKRPPTRQFTVKTHWVESVILPRQVRQADGNLRSPSRETVAGKKVELRERITSQRGRGTVVLLRPPQRPGLGKKTARIIKDSREAHLMQQGAVVRVRFGDLLRPHGELGAGET